MTSIRAAVLTAPGIFEVQARPCPVPGPGDVLIRVERAGICGTDLHIFHGHYAADRLPLVPGHEFAGVVMETGADMRRFRPGQRVVVDINMGCGSCFWCRRNEILSCPDMQQMGITRDGAFAEMISVPGRLVIPVPDGLAPDIAALTEPVACVVRAARKASAGFARSVVILGAGPIGNLHVQMMRLTGAAPVIAFDLSESRCRMALAAGADAAVSDPTELHDTVMRLTGGRGADIAVECVGARSLYEQAFRLIRRGGHVAFFGITAPDETVPVDILGTILREDSLKGSVAGMGEDMHDALTLLAHGRFNTALFTAAAYPLHEIQEAFETIPARPQHLKTQIVF